MPEPSLPEILQAEAYYCGKVVLIRNSKTKKVVERTKHHPDIAEPICEAPNFPAFLAATAGAIRDATVIVTLGDSRTTNFGSWPSILATTRLRGSDAVVLNLADWSCCSEDHFAVTEYLLDYLHRYEAKDISVILFGELIDLHRKLDYYTRYMDNLCPLPFTNHEEQLSAHGYGRELARLHDQAPGDLNGAALWIAQRVIAIARLMDQVCAGARAKFLAVLEPNAYSDNSPGYLSALHRAYEEEAPRGFDFAAWCRQRSYARDPSEYCKQDLRPLIDRLRASWSAQQRRSNHGVYADLSDLFSAVDECCFSPVFDAIHYNSYGSALIADALFDLLAVRVPNSAAARLS